VQRGRREEQRVVIWSPEARCCAQTLLLNERVFHATLRGSLRLLLETTKPHYVQGEIAITDGEGEITSKD